MIAKEGIFLSSIEARSVARGRVMHLVTFPAKEPPHLATEGRKLSWPRVAGYITKMIYLWAHLSVLKGFEI